MLSDEADDRWLPVEPTLISALRAGLTLIWLLGSATAVVFYLILPPHATFFPLTVLFLLTVFTLWTTLVWAPRYVRYLKYLLRENDVNLQKGFLFWKTLSVSFNRVQHVEVNQGPIDRLFGLASLKVYTAGTMGSDMKIPGLRLAHAQELKSRILHIINSEEDDDSF